MAITSRVEKLEFEKKDLEEFPGGLVVKDLVLSLLWLGFYPWPRDLSYAVGMAKNKNKNKNKQTKKHTHTKKDQKPQNIKKKKGKSPKGEAVRQNRTLPSGGWKKEATDLRCQRDKAIKIHVISIQHC